MTYASKAFTKKRGGGWRNAVPEPIRDALMKLDPTSAALGSLAGIAAGTYAVPAFAQAAQEASMLSLASATGLALAAATMAMRSRGKHAPVSDHYPRPADFHAFLRGPLSATKWLADKVGALPGEVVRSDARVLEALAGHLTPTRIALEPCHRLLHVAFAMHEAGHHFREGPRNSRLGVHDVLREVSDLGQADNGAIEGYLVDLERRLGEKSWETLARNVAARRRLHGSRETGLMGALSAARGRRGILPCAGFRWLFVLDRDLWYALQNLGRQEGFVEGIAALSHFRAEQAAGEALSEWQLDEAVAWVEASARRDAAQA